MSQVPIIVPNYELYRDIWSPIDPGAPDEHRDYIEADRFNMIDFRGRYLFVMVDEHLELAETSVLYRALSSRPFQERTLSRETQCLVSFRMECYNVTKDLQIDDDFIRELARWYTETRKDHSILSLNENPDTNLQLGLARYYMGPQDFYKHFRKFDSLDKTHERFERSQAIKALLKHNLPGIWLLRHSSYNRPENPNTLADIIRFGLRYYVLSYSKNHHDTMIIKHILITFNVTTGWSSTVDATIIFPNFLDCLEYILQKHHLGFANLHSEYINI